MPKLQRTQILLDREQHQALSEYAAAAGQSMSALVREAVAAYLAERERAAKITEARLALEALEAIRDTIETDLDLTGLLEEVRQERANELPVGWESLP